MKIKKSQIPRKEKPTKRPRDPPISDIKETGGYTRTSVFLTMSVETRLKPK